MQLAPMEYKQKCTALQADVVSVWGSQSFAHFLFTQWPLDSEYLERTLRPQGTVEPLDGRACTPWVTRWWRGTQESLLTSYVCIRFCVSVKLLFVLVPWDLGIYLLPQHSTPYPDLHLLSLRGPGQRSPPLWSFPWLPCAGGVSYHSLDHAPIVLWTYS